MEKDDISRAVGSAVILIGLGAGAVLGYVWFWEALVDGNLLAAIPLAIGGLVALYWLGRFSSSR
ncbi:hypothetical protein CLV56_2834 [Mumia flava]|uniref:Uncharacterized protein n=1 Tax=Mumia flava TaxID=1348852 RepID=A0A0B2BVT3_9ACTN|nr:hypothetical protein [Mumia flava]PJJ58582.1 hypothetical protein CLV56_2834 [Mumia flava]